MAIRIIDIPDDVYKDIEAYNQIPCADNYTITKAILNSKALPDNATNGDAIKSLFPNYIYIGTCVLDRYENILLHDINYNWWKAPYTKEKNNDKI